jgi:hypothetical protein
MDEPHTMSEAYIPKFPFYPGPSSPDEKAEQLVRLALDLCRADLTQEGGGLSDLELSGLWWVITSSVQQRPSVGAAAIDAGILEIGMAMLHNSSPHEWASWRTVSGFSAVFHVFGNLSIQLQPGVAQLFIDRGVIEAAVSALQAFELRGSGKLDEADAITLNALFWCFNNLDLDTPEAVPIVKRLRQMPATLRFVMDHPVTFVKCLVRKLFSGPLFA